MSLSSTGGNGNFHSSFRGASGDGTSVFFQTDEPLVPTDTDTTHDLYQRTGGTTTLVSIGSQAVCPIGTCPADFDGASMDGSHLYFHTIERLVSTDTDDANDIYHRFGGITTIVSQGPNGGNGNSNDAFFTGNSADGSKVWFVSYEELVAGDADANRKDVYQHTGGVTTQISTGPQVGSPLGADFADASADGSRVFFYTDEAIVPADQDGTNRDIYERSGGTTTLVSTGPLGGTGAFQATPGGISSDGTHVFFNTNEQLLSSDTDGGSRDVYDRSGGTTTLVSTSSTSPNGAYNADFRGSSSEGSVVFITTDEPLVTADTDNGCLDAAGQPTKKCLDVYQRFSGATTLLSTSPTSPNGAYHASFGGSDTLGSRVFFQTAEPLVAEDTETGPDVYERFGGTTTSLVSKGTIGGSQQTASFYLSTNQEGTRVFFFTPEQLLPSDTDAIEDIYERTAPVGIPMGGSGTSTSLISAGPGSFNGAVTPLFGYNSLDGTRAFFETYEQIIGPPLLGADTDSSYDFYMAYVGPTTFPRPGGGTPLRVPLVVAFADCSSPDVIHTAPLALPSCSSAPAESGQLTVSTTGRLQAFAKLEALPGNTGTPADEADIRISASTTDVRNQSDGTDYAGTLLLRSTVRQTDRANGTTGAVAGTVEDLGFSVPVGCVTNTDPLIGSACSIVTTADTLVPGMAKEGKRSVLSMSSLELLDAGADGSVTPVSGTCPYTCGSGDEQTFLRQGVFLP